MANNTYMHNLLIIRQSNYVIKTTNIVIIITEQVLFVCTTKYIQCIVVQAYTLNTIIYSNKFGKTFLLNISNNSRLKSPQCVRMRKNALSFPRNLPRLLLCFPLTLTVFSGSRRRLRSSDTAKYIKRTTRTKSDERNFSPAGPTAWNSLPAHLQPWTD